MQLLTRPTFIQTIGHVSIGGDPSYTLLYTEINHAPKVASLLQGIAAEEQLISNIQEIIYDRIKGLPKASMGKLGWNRFAVIANLSIKESLKVANELVELLDSREIAIDGVSYYPKLIIGVTPLAPEYKTPERILAAVDEALFQARRTGSSIVKLIEHDDPVLLDYYDSLKLLPTITESLKNQSFVLFAQPIVPIGEQLSTSTDEKFEVLLRHKNEEGDIDVKSHFLKTAELFHIIREVDYYVVHQFCRFFAQQSRPNTLYSLNISGNTVRYTPFLDGVAKEFKHYGVNPEQVCFEITETVADRDFEQAIEFMNLLKNRFGCKLSLDDIGIGSSNLANLSRFNLDFMKIDGSFVRALLDDPYSELVVSFITSAATLFGRHTIAEYVESAEQLEKLEKLGVNYSQGYFTGKPELLFDPSQD